MSKDKIQREILVVIIVTFLSFGKFELITSLYFVNFKLGSKSQLQQLTNSREISPKRKSNYDDGNELYLFFLKIFMQTNFILYYLHFKLLNRRITSNFVITRHSSKKTYYNIKE